MILVSGVTGNIGGELARLLVASGHAVRGLSRDPKRAKADAKVALVQGDFARPETLPKAFEGCDKAFFVGHPGPDFAGLARGFFDAAEAAGVKHVVVVSSSTIGIEPKVRLGIWHREMEEALEATGLAWTMLRPGNFSTNALRWAPMIKAGAVFLPNPESKSAPIDPRDIASVAHAALTTSGHEGKVHWLIGSKTITAREQVATIGRAVGKEVRVVEITPEQARDGMIKAGLPESFAGVLLEILRAREEGERGEGTVRATTGREARSFEDWVNDNRSSFA